MKKLIALAATAAWFASCAPSQLPSTAALRTLEATPYLARERSAQRSWMLPSARGVKRLLYVSDGDMGDVDVYDYDNGNSVGVLEGFSEPSGQCVDKRGDIWITGYKANSLAEFAHGGSKPIKQLKINGAGPLVGCSVAPDGDLAATSQYYGGKVWVFKKASGTPESYSAPNCTYLWAPGYDLQGNLYVEADNSGPFICELPHGGTGLRTVQFNAPIDYQGSVMWDGKYITLTDQDYQNAYQTAIYRMTEDSSGNLTEVGKTILTDSCDGDYDVVPQPFIVGKANTPVNVHEGKDVVGGNVICQSEFDYWKYPRGGEPFARLSSAPVSAGGQAVSIAP